MYSYSKLSTAATVSSRKNKMSQTKLWEIEGQTRSLLWQEGGPGYNAFYRAPAVCLT